MKVLAASSPVVDWGKLGQVILYSVVVGIGITLCFSLAIVGATRFAESRRAEAATPAALYGLLALAGFAATLAAVVIGIVVMASKS